MKRLTGKPLRTSDIFIPPKTTPTRKAKAIDKNPIFREVKQLIVIATTSAKMEANASKLTDIYSLYQHFREDTSIINILRMCRLHLTMAAAYLHRTNTRKLPAKI